MVFSGRAHPDFSEDFAKNLVVCQFSFKKNNNIFCQDWDERKKFQNRISHKSEKSFPPNFFLTVSNNALKHFRMFLDAFASF